MPKVTENVGVLRQGWLDAASSLAPGVEVLRQSLDEVLQKTERDHSLNEQSLLGAIDEAMLKAGAELPQDVGQTLVRRLQRSVYEYLLSLDAILPEEAAHWPSETVHAEDAVLIGAEEVAALRSIHAEPPPKLAAVTPEAAPREAVEPEAAAPEAVAPEAVAPEAAAPELEVAAPPAEAGADEAAPAELAQQPEAGSTDAEPAADMTDTDPAEKSRRFAIFGRSGSRTPQPPPRKRPAAPVAAELETEASPLPAPDRAAPPRPEESFHPLPANHGHDGEPFMAPREGFHIREEAPPLVISTPVDLAGEFEATVARPRIKEPAPVVPEAREERAGKSWNVRDDQSISREPEDPAFASDAVAEARRKIDERLGRRRCDEAASLVQKLSQDPGGRAVSELGLDVGDRCRALGKNNSALSCYLAATRADPVFDQPLLRLADICIDDHDIDLAVAYLERVARFYRLSGDHRAAVRIFRKIATVAPYRDDILSMLVRIQATGHFDD